MFSVHVLTLAKFKFRVNNVVTQFAKEADFKTLQQCFLPEKDTCSLDLFTVHRVTNKLFRSHIRVVTY